MNIPDKKKKNSSFKFSYFRREANKLGAFFFYNKFQILLNLRNDISLTMYWYVYIWHFSDTL